MGTVLVVVSTNHRAQHVRTVLGEKLSGHDVRVFSTEGPVLQAPANQMGVDVAGLTLRPLWIRTWSGSAKRLLDAAKEAEEVVVLHEPTLLAAGEAQIVVQLFSGNKTPVRCVGVTSFEAPVILGALAGTEVTPFPFDQDAYDAHVAATRIASYGATSAVNQILEGSFEVPLGLGFLLGLGSESHTSPERWSVQGQGDGFTAHGDTFNTRAEAETEASKLKSSISVSTVDEERTVDPPCPQQHNELVLQLTKKFNFSVSYAEEMLNRLLDTGFLGRVHAPRGATLPDRIGDTARMVIEDTCGPTYVGSRVLLYSCGTWYVTDPGVRPSMLASQPKDVRAVYGLVWGLTVASFSTPLRLRSRIVNYSQSTRGPGGPVVLMAGGDTVLDEGWRRPVAGVLDIPAADQIGDDFTLHDIRVIEHPAKEERGFSDAYLLRMRINVLDALTYAVTAGLVARDADAGGNYVTTEKGAWLLSFLLRLDPLLRDASTSAVITGAVHAVTTGVPYKDVVQALLDKAAGLSKAALSLPPPERCPSCKKKVSLHVNKHGMGTRCKACTKSFTLTITDKGMELQ